MKKILRFLTSATLLVLAIVLTSCAVNNDCAPPEDPDLSKVYTYSLNQDSQENAGLHQTGQDDISLQKPPFIPSYLIPNEIIDRAINQTIVSDGREIIVNSGCGWAFTLPENNNQITNLKDTIRTVLGIDINQVLDKRINVRTYDAAPVGSKNIWDEKITYLYVFSGDDLVYQDKFASNEQFRAVVDLCVQLGG